MRLKILQGNIEKRKECHYEFDLDSTPIGEGGMGVVYRGYKVLEKTGSRSEVAIKVLHEDLPEEVYARAEREASIQLRHDNLVEMLGFISDYETDRLGIPVYHHYVISEFLHGMELSALLKGEFETKDGEENSYARQLYFHYLKDREKISLEIIRNISSGVLALHDKGYIHRDIDPSNIMVTTDGCIKLIDFGIAKNLHSLGSKDKLTTATGQFIGKAEYASPELVLGDVHNQDYTTDIYALGILLYRLIVGQLPFEGSQYEVLQMQLKRKVPVKNIENPALARIVRKATEKLQSNRYATIAEFRVAIDVAAKSKQRFFVPAVTKHGIIAAVFIMICIGFYMLWPFYSIPPVPSMRDKFNHALVLLDSDLADSVKVGFERMKELAFENYDSAKVEVGITYFTYNSNSRSFKIRNRRALLGLTDNDSCEADSVIRYLSKIQDASPEVYFVLGYTYASEDVYNKNGGLDEAINCLEKAQLDINRNKIVGHGYIADSLKNMINANLDIIKAWKNE